LIYFPYIYNNNKPFYDGFEVFSGYLDMRFGGFEGLDMVVWRGETRAQMITSLINDALFPIYKPQNLLTIINSTISNIIVDKYVDKIVDNYVLN